MKRFLRGLLALAILPVIPSAAHATAYDGRPRLVVILALDQFRGDFLERYRADLGGDGFRLLIDKGAYFPNCYYQYASLMTAPGHASIATGAYSDMHGIAENEWWDLTRNTHRPVTSVEDENFQLLTASGLKQPGVSPRNLRASTIGDEVRMATRGSSKLFGVSLKDRSAILFSGQSANAAYWIDQASGAFMTSTYYMSQLPNWVPEYGRHAAQIAADSKLPGTHDFYHEVGGKSAAVSYELGFAEELIRREELGHHLTTDVLTISISSTDILGHRVGPDSEELHALVVAIDRELAQFFSFLDTQVDGGLGATWIAMTGDHGVAPEPSHAGELGMDARRLDLERLIDAVNTSLNARYSPHRKIVYIFPDQELPFISLSDEAFRGLGINEAHAEQIVASAITEALEHNAALYPLTKRRGGSSAKDSPVGFRLYTRDQIATNQLPPSEFNRRLERSYSTEIGWYDMLILDPYATEQDDDLGIHYGPWSYDRHVPLAFYGSAFLPGTYLDQVEPIDLATTLAAALRVNRPSSAEGSVLKQAIKKTNTSKDEY